MDGHSYSGIRGYSDMGGRVDIPGLSVDGQSYCGIRGYSDKGGVDIPGLSMDGHGYSGIRRYTLTGGVWGGGGGCKSGHLLTIQGWSQLLRHTGIL